MVVSRITTLVMSSGAGSRTWQATATTQDTAAGSSVVITVTQSNTGLTPPVASTLFELIYKTESGTVKTVTLAAGSASQTDTFFFTNTGLTGGSSRSGTIEIVLHAVSTTTGFTYDYTTDGTTSTAQATYTASQVDRGWIRGTTTATTTLSQAAYYYPDVITATTTLGAAPFISRTVGIVLTGKSNILSAGSTSTSFTTALGNTDNTLPTLVLATRSTTTSFPNATLTGLPWTTATPTEASATTDPRLIFVHDLQANDNTLGATPGSKNITTGGRLTSDLDFITQQITNENSVGQNGITWNCDLYDGNQLVYTSGSPKRTAITSAAASGVAGWGNAFQTWNEALPGGTWTSKQTITAPSTATGLEINNTRTLTLLSANPNYEMIVDIGDLSHSATHLVAGNTFTVGMTLRDRSTKQYVTLDASPVPSITVLRINPATQKGQFLSQTGVWTDLWTGSAQVQAYSYPLTQGTNDPFLWLLNIPTDATWSSIDVFPIGLCYVGGTPYTSHSYGVLMGKQNPHDSHEFNPTGLFM